jgi:hypothetical protein
MGACMNANAAGVVARLVRLWTRAYTQGLPAEIRRGRLGEIESDLWECQHDADRPANAAEMFARLLLGMPHDLWWRLEQTAAASARDVAPAPRLVRASAFTCSLAFHLALMAGIVWWASWPAERVPPRVFTSQPHLTDDRAVPVAAPPAVFESEWRPAVKRREDTLAATVFPAIGAQGVLTTPVAGRAQQPIYLLGTWTLDPSRSDGSHDWAAALPAGDLPRPPPPPPPGPASLTITNRGNDLVVDQKWPQGSQSITCDLVDAATFSARTDEKMPDVPSTIAFWDGARAVTRVLVSLKMSRTATMPVELRTTYRADETTLQMNSEARMPQGMYTRRFVYARQK